MQAKDVDAASPVDAPMVMTMNRSKGMEFTRVVLYGLFSDALLSSYKKLAPAEQADALMREQSLLYVAATRARDGLVVSWSGKPLELLGTNYVA